MPSRLPHRDEVPLLDMEAGTGEQFDAACRDLGLFLLINHGVTEAVSATTWDTTRAFFRADMDVKTRVQMTDAYPYGYSGCGKEALKSGSLPDRKESFCIGPENSSSMACPRQWPDYPGMQEAWTLYYREMERLSARLLEKFGQAQGFGAGWFRDKTDRHISALRALSYEPPTGDASRIGAGEHTDYGLFTILLVGSEGLQVKRRNGEWVSVPLVNKSLVVGLGDMMSYCARDGWVSAPHRVVCDPGWTLRRQSIAYFCNPNEDAVINRGDGCLPVRAGDYLMARHRAATA
jgi:isopenicillin N synthase-like dioxygenase